MKGFTSGAVASDFRIDVRAARTGVLVLFYNEHPRAFGEYEPVAVGGKGTRGAFGCMIPGLGERAQHGVSLNDAGSDRRIDAVRQEHGLSAGLDVLEGVS